MKFTILDKLNDFFRCGRISVSAYPVTPTSWIHKHIAMFFFDFIDIKNYNSFVLLIAYYAHSGR